MERTTNLEALLEFIEILLKKYKKISENDENFSSIMSAKINGKIEVLEMLSEMAKLC